LSPSHIILTGPEKFANIFPAVGALYFRLSARNIPDCWPAIFSIIGLPVSAYPSLKIAKNLKITKNTAQEQP